MHSTRYYPQPLRDDLVPRRYLFERLEQQHDANLTLVIAPAGFGKSTLVSAWLKDREHNFSWLSIDRSDTDPTRFWHHLVKSIQTVEPRIGTGTLELLKSSIPASPRVLAATLSDELNTSVPGHYVVLDDYHLVDTDTVHDGVNALLDVLPLTWHFVVVSRHEPPFRLGRRRTAQGVNEIGADELKFNKEEVSYFFSSRTKVPLSTSQIEVVTKKTEGWVSGLQLAALSLRTQGDPASFIDQLAGDSRYIIDFLVEEVYSRQPEEIRRMLLCTSILERMCGDLCESIIDDAARTEELRGQAFLDYLSHINLFLVPMDEAGYWFRYHHLFRDLLVTRLHQRFPALVGELHSRAARWFESKDDPESALGHWLEAGAYDSAAMLLERLGPRMLWKRGELQTLYGLISQLPESTRQTPQLSILQGWVLYLSGKTHGALPFLSEADRRLKAAPAEDAATRQRILRQASELAALQGFVACRHGVLGDIEAAAGNVEERLTELEEEPSRHKVLLLLSSAEILCTQGRLSDATARYEDALAGGYLQGDRLIAYWSAVRLAETARSMGDLRQADIRTEEFARICSRAHPDDPLRAVELYVRAENLRERGDIDEALELLAQAIGKLEAVSVWLTRDILLARSQAFCCLGDFESAAAAAIRAKQLESKHQLYPDWYGWSGTAYEAYVRMLSGDIAAASRWADGDGRLDSGPPTIRDKHSLIYGRIRAAQGRFEEALDVVANTTHEASSNNRRLHVLTASVVEAIVRRQSFGLDDAMDSFGRALDFSAMQGHTGTYLEQGAEVLPLLYGAIDRNVNRNEAQRLLDAFMQTRHVTDQPAKVDVAADCLEPLSKREIEVLGLIADGQSNKQIASALYLSLHTVKVHTRNIYRKLDVGSRTQAVSKATTLGIISVGEERPQP